MYSVNRLRRNYVDLTQNVENQELSASPQNTLNFLIVVFLPFSISDKFKEIHKCVCMCAHVCISLCKP